MSKVLDGIVNDLKSIPKKLKPGKGKGGADIKKLLMLNFPFILVGYFADKMAWAFRQSEAANAGLKLMDALQNLGGAFKNPLPSFNPIDLCIGAGAGFLFRFLMNEKKKNAKKYRHGEEYGSARWGTPKDIEPYMDNENFENNILLTETEKLQMNGRPSSPKYARNKNILIIGGSGSGKTRFFVKPNIMQLHSSYVCTDPKGTICIR